MEKANEFYINNCNKYSYETVFLIVLSLMTCVLFAQDVTFKKGNF